MPVPYENEAYSSDLTHGTSSVFADGGNMIANYGSVFARSVFDEPGSMGGIISGTNKAEADWISHSFDVFFEKKPACRLTDKMFMNHRNTVNMEGLCQIRLPYPVLDRKICDAICKCRNRIAREFRQKIREFEAVPTLSLAKLLMQRFLGENSELPKSGDKGVKTGPRQKCFAQQFNQSGATPWEGATPQDPCYLTEVPYKIKSGDLIKTEDMRTTFEGGPQSPASVKDTLDVARTMGKGKIVIWDLVTLKDPGLTAEWNNIDQIIEIKFEGDSPTTNQETAIDTKMNEKLRIIHEEMCFCDDEDDGEKESIESKVWSFLKQLGRSLAEGPGGSPVPGAPPIPPQIFPIG